jgi:hypothetical protein
VTEYARLVPSLAVKIKRRRVLSGRIGMFGSIAVSRSPSSVRRVPFAVPLSVRDQKAGPVWLNGRGCGPGSRELIVGYRNWKFCLIIQVICLIRQNLESLLLRLLRSQANRNLQIRVEDYIAGRD